MSQVGTSGVSKERWIIGTDITLSDGNIWPYVCESATITRFLEHGYVVLMPYGGSQRYDLVNEDA